MNTLLLFIARIAVVIYLLAGAGIFFAVRGLWQARREKQRAVFGLEREAALHKQQRAFRSAIMLALLIGMIYVIQNIIVPNLSEPEAAPEPTPIVFVTALPTATPALLLFPTVTPTVGPPPAEVGEATAPPETPVNGCEIIGSTISLPQPGDTVSGQVAVRGEANVLNFAQYKFEVKGPSTGGDWAVVGTYNVPVVNGLLGVWDSTSLMPGNYILRLVIFRQDGTYLPPCEVPIIISSQPVPTLSP